MTGSTGVLKRVRGWARPVRETAVRGAAVPVRWLALAAMRRYPSLEQRIADWSWLWQPGSGRQYHEELYAQERPYSDYEVGKYDDLIEQLGDRRYRVGLEAGCSEGLCTEKLVGLCDELHAVDISETAISRASRRLAGDARVRFARHTLPFDFPTGTFDLIVCSDVLYLWESDTVDVGLERFAGALRPGGSLALLNYLGEFGTPTTGTWVAERALARSSELGLRYVRGESREGVGPGGAGYRIDILERS